MGATYKAVLHPQYVDVAYLDKVLRAAGVDKDGNERDDEDILDVDGDDDDEDFSETGAVPDLRARLDALKRRNIPLPVRVLGVLTNELRARDNYDTDGNGDLSAEALAQKEADELLKLHVAALPHLVDWSSNCNSSNASAESNFFGQQMVRPGTLLENTQITGIHDGYGVSLRSRVEAKSEGQGGDSHSNSMLRALCHVTKLADKVDGENLNLNIRELVEVGESIKAKVLALNYLDRSCVVSAAQSVVDEGITSYHDLKIGQMVKAEIKRVIEPDGE